MASSDFCSAGSSVQFMKLIRKLPTTIYP